MKLHKELHEEINERAESLCAIFMEEPSLHKHIKTMERLVIDVKNLTITVENQIHEKREIEKEMREIGY